MGTKVRNIDHAWTGRTVENRHTRKRETIQSVEEVADYDGQITVFQFGNGDRTNLRQFLEHWELVEQENKR